MTADPNGILLTPLGILARLRAIADDRDLTPAAARAVSRVVLCANKAGLAWPGFRFLAKTCGLSHEALSRALGVPGGLALGRHLEPAGRGPRGVQIYRVLPIPKDGASAPATEAPPTCSSAPTTEALAEAQRACSDASARLVPLSSAPVSGFQRACLGGVTVTGNRELVTENWRESELEGERTSHTPGSQPEDQQPTATTTATTAADIEKVLSYAFPSGKPNEKAEAACRDRIAEALRLGATPQLLAWAVQSKKARGKRPWDRIQEAGEYAAELVRRARECWPGFVGLTLADLFAYVPPPATTGLERALVLDVQACKNQATQWPPDGRT
ncbi:MAG: hypothetical protein IMZ44_13300 [Planctomycetes bacterium]|nr:hypothetical protein [Planctomycetota bacterium]